MWDYEFEETPFGIVGTLPTGDKVEFATEEEYREAYKASENEIYDGLAEWYAEQEVVDYPEDWVIDHAAS